jgi:hypothetical protein
MKPPSAAWILIAGIGIGAIGVVLAAAVVIGLSPGILGLGAPSAPTAQTSAPQTTGQGAPAQPGASQKVPAPAPADTQTKK